MAGAGEEDEAHRGLFLEDPDRRAADVWEEDKHDRFMAELDRIRGEETSTPGLRPGAEDGRLTQRVGWSNGRGSTTWLADRGGDQYALINIGGKVRLDVIILADNGPGLNVALHDLDDARCAAHIHSWYDGWHAHECHIPGVHVDRGGTAVRQR